MTKAFAYLGAGTLAALVIRIGGPASFRARPLRDASVIFTGSGASARSGP